MLRWWLLSADMAVDVAVRRCLGGASLRFDARLGFRNAKPAHRDCYSGLRADL